MAVCNWGVNSVHHMEQLTLRWGRGATPYPSRAAMLLATRGLHERRMTSNEPPNGRSPDRVRQFGQSRTVMEAEQRGA